MFIYLYLYILPSFSHFLFSSLSPSLYSVTSGNFVEVFEPVVLPGTTTPLKCSLVTSHTLIPFTQIALVTRLFSLSIYLSIYLYYTIYLLYIYYISIYVPSLLLCIYPSMYIYPFILSLYLHPLRIQSSHYFSKNSLKSQQCIFPSLFSPLHTSSPPLLSSFPFSLTC